MLTVPFTHVLELVRLRTVYLSNGTANLLCIQLSEYLSTVFSRILECSSYTMRKSATLKKCFNEDTRFSDVSRRLINIFQSHSQYGGLFDGSGDHWITSSRLLPGNNKIALN